MTERMTDARFTELDELQVDSCSGNAPYNQDVWTLEKARGELVREVRACREDLERSKRASEDLGAIVVQLTELMREAFRHGASEPFEALHMIGNSLAEMLTDADEDAGEHNLAFQFLEAKRLAVQAEREELRAKWEILVERTMMASAVLAEAEDPEVEAALGPVRTELLRKILEGETGRDELASQLVPKLAEMERRHAERQENAQGKLMDRLAERLANHAVCDQHPEDRVDPGCPFCRDRSAYLAYVNAGGRDHRHFVTGATVDAYDVLTGKARSITLTELIKQDREEYPDAP